MSEGEIAQLVHDEEVETVQVTGQAALFAAAGFDLETIEKIEDIVEPAPQAVVEQTAPCGFLTCETLFTIDSRTMVE